MRILFLVIGLGYFFSLDSAFAYKVFVTEDYYGARPLLEVKKMDSQEIYRQALNSVGDELVLSAGDADYIITMKQEKLKNKGIFGLPGKGITYVGKFIVLDKKNTEVASLDFDHLHKVARFDHTYNYPGDCRSFGSYMRAKKKAIVTLMENLKAI